MSHFFDQLRNGLQVTENDAKQDRITLKLKRWQFEGTVYEFEAFSSRLSSTFCDNGIQRRIFNKQQGDAGRAIWPIQGGAGTRRYYAPPGTPLFSGRLRGYQSSFTMDREQKVWQLIAELSINPTRALVYESRAVDLAIASNENKDKIETTLFARNKPNIGNIFPFISGDNFEQGSRLHRTLFRQPNWDMHTRRYWGGIVNLFDSVLGCAAADAGGNIVRLRDERLTLQAIETYWDIRENDPVATVAALERPFRSLGSNSSIQWYSLPENAKAKIRSRGVVIGDQDNSPVIKIRVAKATEIKIYAKTTSFVRIEVTHVQGAADIGSFTSSDAGGIFVWIDKCKKKSTDRLNHLLSSLKSNYSNSSSLEYEPQRLIYDLYSVYKDWDLAIKVLGMLIHSGKIEVRKSSPIGKEIKSLIKNKIIIRVSPRNSEIRIFHVSERYQKALDALSYRS